MLILTPHCTYRARSRQLGLTKWADGAMQVVWERRLRERARLAVRMPPVASTILKLF